MFSLLKFLKQESSSKSVAKERLTAVLAQDRANCSPELIDVIKVEILKALSAYVDVDSDNQNLSVQISSIECKGKNQSVLVANIPIRSMKRAAKPPVG